MSSLTFRQKLGRCLSSNFFTRLVTTLILLNAVTLGLETDAAVMESHGLLLRAVDQAILAFFVVEVLLRLYVSRLAFFKSGWNVFDFVIVGISLLPSVGPFAVLRTLRILRVLRLISVVPKMRKVITALFSAIPGMTSVLSVLLVIFYVASVMTTQIFGASSDPAMQQLYGSIGASMFTLFQLMTLEGWSQDIAGPTMALFPASWAFFVSFIIVTSFAVLNLFIGIIVDAMNLMHEEERAASVDKAHSEEMLAIHDVREEIAALRRDLQAARK
jgi:voltage-gated sodium channel